MRSLFWIVVAIIIYGSTFPFSFAMPEWDGHNWANWLTTTEQKTTNGDMLSNLLTFIPLGYFAYHYLKTKILSKLTNALIVVSGGFLFAFVLQVIQFFIPTRVPTVGDALFDLWGIVFGVALAMLVEWGINRNSILNARWEQAFMAPLLLICLWCMYQLFPFFPEFSSANLIESLSPLWLPPFVIWYSFIFDLMMWWCFFVLVNQNPWFKLTRMRAFYFILGLSLLKLIIAYNSIGWQFLLGAVIGFFLAVKVTPKITLSQGVNGKQRSVKILCTSFIVVLVFSNFYPWFIKMFTSEFNWWPFNTYLKGSLWVNTRTFLEKLFVYGAFFYLLKLLLNDKIKAFLIGFASISLIEFMQLFLSFGRADITDLVMFFLIAYSLEKLAEDESLAPAEKAY